MPEYTLRETASHWVAGLDAALTSVLSTSESNALIREIFAVFLLLRWADQQEAELEAMAVFEERSYQPLFPPALQWRQWSYLEQPTQQLNQLARYVEGLHRDGSHPMAAYLHLLAEPLRRALKVNSYYLLDVVRWIGELPLETSSERLALLEVFDQVIAETENGYDGQYSTPTNIAQLVVALANPQPGERIYDPCFGSGNFILAAWRQAERSRKEPRRFGHLLDVAGLEINNSAFLIGLTRMLLAGIESPRLELGNSLEREALSSPSRQGFDIVLANPPFGVKTSRDPWRYQHFAIQTSDSTGLFIQHALSQLKLHGRAVIVVPEGFLFRGGSDRELRRYLLEQGFVEAVIGLPAGAFAPYTGIKCSLLLLNKQGGATRIRMADASSLFEQRSGRKAPVVRSEVIDQLAYAIRRPEFNKNLQERNQELNAHGLSGPIAWELSIDEIAAAEWDLSPRHREKGGLDDSLANLKESLGDTGTVLKLSEIAEIFTGRAIKSADLLDEPPHDKAIGYIRIKDLAQGKVSRVSSWLRPELVSGEQRWCLLAGDVLISKSGTIGKAALVRNGAIGSIAANGLFVLRVKREQLDAGYLLAYLASPACQTWLSAQSRGSAIQHINQNVLLALPVPVPSLMLQARAAAQFREFGTDALTFLAQAVNSNESNRLSTWLSELDNKVPTFVEGLEDTPTLSQFEPIAVLVNMARRWLDQEQFGNQVARWLLPLTEAIIPLSGIASIPAGPSLLSVLQEAERSMQVALTLTTGHLPTESQARAIASRLSDWLRAAIADLVGSVSLQVCAAPDALNAGSFTEFIVELENTGSLPLRNLRLETRPDWGIATCAYLAEKKRFALQLRGDAPKLGSALSLNLIWQGLSLAGKSIEGEIELAIRINHEEQAYDNLSDELHGSPYVTGSPLEPMQGHNVFYGRDELIAQISRQISGNGNVVLLEGNRRAGKTSILKHLEGQKSIPGWLAVYSSLQGAEGASQVVGVPTANVFREIARSIATALTKLKIEVPLPNGKLIAAGKPALGIARACSEGISTESPFVDFRDYLEQVLAVLKPLNLGLVLMLDEFDKLQEGIDNGVTSPQVPENIRFLIQTYAQFSAILTGSRRLKRLREEYWSALYGLGTSIPVTVLDVVNARKIITEPVNGQLAYSHEAIERIIQITARHPYLMQCLCNRIFDFAVQTKSRSITVSVVSDAAHALVKDNEHFASLWDYAGLGPETGRYRRQMILLLCARNFKHNTHVGFASLHEQLTQEGVDINDEVLDTDLSYLRELELIDLAGEIGDGEYRLTIPLMAEWIEQQQDADVVASRARTEAEEENV